MILITLPPVTRPKPATYKTLTPGSKADNGSEYYQKILCLQQRITSDLNQRKINYDANGEGLVLYISLRLVGSRYGDMRNGFSSSLDSSADLLSVGGSVGRPARGRTTRPDGNKSADPLGPVSILYSSLFY